MKSKFNPNLLLSPILHKNNTLPTKTNIKLKILTDSQKNINENVTGSFAGINLYTNTPMSTTNNHKKKLSFTNSIPTNYSKMGSLNSSSISKNPVSNYISTSTLQSGIASYSIPRQKRFLNNYNESPCDSIYNLPEYKRIGITIPHSIRKSSFLKKDQTPSSQDYVFTTVFDDILKSKKGISFSTKHSLKVKINFLF